MSGICWEPYNQPRNQIGRVIQAIGKLHNKTSVRAGETDNLRFGRRSDDNSPNRDPSKNNWNLKHKVMMAFAWLTVISVWALLATIYEIVSGIH